MRFGETPLKETTLDNICKFFKGKGISKNDLSEEGTPCIRYGELYTTYKETVTEIKERTDLNKNDLVLSSKYDVLLPCSGETAIDLGNATCVLKNGVALGGDITIIKTDENGVFLSYYLNYKRTELAKYAQGISIMHLYPKDFKKLVLNIPSLDEQDKIASFLLDIDQKIELLHNKKDQFIEYKQYLLQNLFPQNGSCVPKLRFKQFTTNWNRTSLNHVATIETGFTPSTSNNSYWNGDYSWLSIADMNQGKYIFNTSKTITNIATKNKPIIKKGTLIMSFKLTIGKLGILKKDMYTNEAICHFNWKNNINISTEFMYYLLSSMNIKKYGSQAAKGITLNKDSLKSIPVQLPPIEEQFKIASFLSSVDKKIDLLDQEIEYVEEYKKGLLQKMFIWRVYLFYCCILSSEYLEIMFYIMIFFLRYVLLTLVSDLMSHIF